jgi:predicted nucleotidyltransferase
VTTTEVIEEIRTCLSRAAPANSRVVLFGSHARGDADEGSGFDVLVIEPEVADSLAEVARLRQELRGVRVPIDVIVVDDDLARRRGAVKGTMVERALREGLELVRT